MASKVYVAISATSRTGDAVQDDPGFSYAATFSSLRAAMGDATHGAKDITALTGTDEQYFYDIHESYSESNGSALNTDQYTQSAGNYITIRCAPGSGHGGIPGQGVTVTWQADYQTKYAFGGFTVVQDIAFDIGGQGSNSNQLVIEENATFLRLLVTGYDITLGGSQTKCISCIVYGAGFDFPAYSSGQIYNCTIISSPGDGIDFPDQGSSPIIAKNCLAMDCRLDYKNTNYGNLTMENCASSDSSAIGPGAITGIIPSSTIEDALNFDGHLKAGNTVETSGADLVLSGDISVDAAKDIDGQPFSGWPIGADQPGAFTVPLSVTVYDAETLQPIENVDVYIYADTGGPLPAGSEISSGQTGPGGLLETSPNFSSVQPFIAQGRKGTTQPFYQEGRSISVLTGDGAQTDIYMISDED